MAQSWEPQGHMEQRYCLVYTISRKPPVKFLRCSAEIDDPNGKEEEKLGIVSRTTYNPLQFFSGSVHQIIT